MTLHQVGGGRTVLIVAVDAPEKERKRLESIGVVPGVEVGILADNGGPILVAIGESRLAIERDLAGMVQVV